MIDMKQIKENVSSKIKTYQHTEEPVQPARVHRQTESRTASMAIGASIHIKGDVTGDEDLVIQGHVEGTINLKGHNVTISKSGKVRANIQARQIVVEGKLDGDMSGEEKVVIRETGNVHGNIVSPRVTLEDGALFKGSIEMEPDQKHAQTGRPVTDTGQHKEKESEFKMA